MLSLFNSVGLPSDHREGGSLVPRELAELLLHMRGPRRADGIIVLD